MESDNGGDIPEERDEPQSIAVPVGPSTSLIQLSRGALAMIALSVTMVCVAVSIAMVTMFVAWRSDKGVSVCRSNLAVAVDVSKGPILLDEGAMLVDLVDTVLNKTDRRVALTADMTAFEAAKPAYEKALADRNRTDEICGK